MTEAQTTNAAPVDLNETQQDLVKQQKRKKMLKIFAIIIIAVAILFAIWTLLFGNTVDTDNAYVGAETAEITSMVSGQVEKVLVSDTQQVKKGDVLAIIDNRDAKIAVAETNKKINKNKNLFFIIIQKKTSSNLQLMKFQI